MMMLENENMVTAAKDSDLVLMQLVYDIIWWKLGLQSIKLGRGQGTRGGGYSLHL